jgi:hypothetical protein
LQGHQRPIIDSNQSPYDLKLVQSLLVPLEVQNQFEQINLNRLDLKDPLINLFDHPTATKFAQVSNHMETDLNQ